MAVLQNRETDIYDTDEFYRRQLDYIKDTWNISYDDKKLVLDFLTTTTLQGIGIVQRTKYVYGLKSFIEFSRIPLRTCQTENLKEWLVHLYSVYKQKTVSTRWYALKKFFCYLEREDMYQKIKVRFRVPIFINIYVLPPSVHSWGLVL
jgi:hypothetical protein